MNLLESLKRFTTVVADMCKPENCVRETQLPRGRRAMLA